MFWLFQSTPLGLMFGSKNPFKPTSFPAALLLDHPFACTVHYSYLVLVFIGLCLLLEKRLGFSKLILNTNLNLQPICKPI